MGRLGAGGRMRVCETQEELEAVRAKLKMTPCPHCKRVGQLIRHGFLRGYDDQHPRRKAVRAQRIFCSNRNRTSGCGRTFSVWWAGKIARLFLTAESLWTFLINSAATGNKRQAFRDLNSGLSDSAPYRIWKRFLKAQSAVRTALGRLCDPPKLASKQPAELTLAHLKAAFGDHACPLVAFQAKLQTFFM
jgi:hypothetical protein